MDYDIKKAPDGDAILEVREPAVAYAVGGASAGPWAPGQIVLTACSPEALKEITEKVCQAARDVLGDKLEKVYLFGSYARGDYDEESDIDILILADIQPEEANSTIDKIDERTGNLDLEYDALICLHMACSTIFHGYVDIMPFYMNVVREGVELYAR